MTDPIRNQSVPANDNDVQDLYDDYGYDPNYDADLEGEGDLVTEDEYVGEDGGTGEGAPVMGPNELRTMLFNMKQQGTLSDADYQVFLGRVNAAVGMSPDRCATELATISNEVYLIANPQAQDTGLDGESGDGGVSSQVEQTKTAIQTLKDKINTSDLSDEQKNEFISQLDRASSSLDINATEEQLGQAQETLTEVEENFTSMISQPKVARDLATQLGKSVEDITAAAETAGVDLDNLPNPPDDKVMKMLNELGVPEQGKMDEFKTIKEQREQEMSDLKSKLAGEDQHWHSETEDPPSQDDFRTSFKYYNREDDKYQQLLGKETEMQTSIVDALSALGYSASAGGSPDQVTVNGTVLDFFNEETGTLGFSTTMTDLTNIQSNEDFYPAPRNTESGDEGHIQDMGDLPSGYPKIQYTVD